MVKENILATIGATPMVRINNLCSNPKVNIFAKLEGFNPTGSIKDRIALRMVETAEREGRLRKGLKIVADNTIGFNALRNSVEDFDSEEVKDRPRQWNNFTPEEIADHNEEKAKNVLRRMTHINDITPRNFVEVCVDMKQQGVAGFNSWGDRPLPEFTMPANQEYKWGFTLIPIK